MIPYFKIFIGIQYQHISTYINISVVSKIVLLAIWDYCDYYDYCQIVMFYKYSCTYTYTDIIATIYWEYLWLTFRLFPMIYLAYYYIYYVYCLY